VGRPKRELNDHEEAFIATFVLADRREREHLKLQRGDVDSSAWAHDPPLDFDHARQIPAEWTSDELLTELRRLGAPDLCTGIYGQLADTELALSDAVPRVHAAFYGDAISCVPGRLAYYDGEWKNARYLLIAG
jgi:hypothetical protein